MRALRKTIPNRFAAMAAESLIALLRSARLASGANQPISLHQNTNIFHLGTKRKADHDKRRAQREPDRRHAPVGLPVCGVKGRGQSLSCAASAHFSKFVIRHSS
jgi:hypothetical protein